MLVACDPYRPAAVKQLQTLGKDSPYRFTMNRSISPPELARRAFDQAQKGGYTVAILDTARRSQLDDALMNELRAITQKVEPAETLLVVDAMLGQEAVNIARAFGTGVTHRPVPDQDRRRCPRRRGDLHPGGYGCPDQSRYMVEGLDALEVYHPSRLSSRILGHGRYDRPHRESRRSSTRPLPKNRPRKCCGRIQLEVISGAPVAPGAQNGTDRPDLDAARRIWRYGKDHLAARCRKTINIDRSDHQFDDRSISAAIPHVLNARSRWRRYRPRLGHGCAGCQSPHQAVPRGTAFILQFKISGGRGLARLFG